MGKWQSTSSDPSEEKEENSLNKGRLMMSKKQLTSIIFIAPLLFTGVFSASALAADAKPYVGYQAPNGAVLDMLGNKVELAPIIAKNKVTLVHFWTTWCPYCQKRMPDLKKLYEQYHGSGLEIIAISFNEEPSLVKSYAEKNKLAFPVYIDRTNVVHDIYQVYVIPITFVVDQKGVIISKIDHKATYQAFVDAVTPLLK